ncbi:SDR family NAD(P)-dependent oxidoreductase [Paeniglutamicibacter psychrophenolicus]|uniref:SDR family NAD(P)-dependent oxidoreductase n=1 Tax=Paeniglutamicibacter psychrophenolicus TaxID=257454 RepID=UPI0027882461|nr:SDR family oxidoreductase [Paeniglutamicibacter psychrophenolicus]MDQ0092236.1 meso-butanediol dehydrogenase/(S,S)-butanediol dehydrogenase/diacetyl reductase [Paeniglutamicibacter psychrophenolicus]
MIAWARYPYEGQVVLVTGAGSGIGRSIARGFLEQGASVAVLGRSAGPLEETIAGFPPEDALVLVADVTSRSAVESAVAGIMEHFGRIDVVVSNAGTSEPSIIEDFEDAAWERMRSVNLDAFITLARAVVPALKLTRGNIVAISSTAGIRGDWKQFAYNATKGALNAMVQSLALDMGAHGVRVNAVAPAFTASRLTVERLENPEFSARLMDRVALERAGEPEDIARSVLFLASPDAGYITGIILPVDGGTTASSGTPRAL